MGKMSKETVYTIPKGRHKSRPFVLDSVKPRHKVESREFKCVLTKSCIYVFRKPGGGLDQNQWDFSKLRGYSFCMFDNHKNTNMGAWRWNPVKTEFDLTSYFHINGETYIGPGRTQILWRDKYTARQAHDAMPSLFSFYAEHVDKFDSVLHYKLLDGVRLMATVGPDELFHYRLLTDWENLQFGVGFKTSSTNWIWVDDWTSMLEAGAWSRDILHWFGGDFSAPHKMKIYEWKV